MTYQKDYSAARVNDPKFDRQFSAIEKEFRKLQASAGAHVHTRDEIADFWDAPFWANIPDKPSTYPPSAHTHVRSEVTDFWSEPFWASIPDKPSTFPPSVHGNEAHDPDFSALGHTHTRSEVTDFWSAAFWSNIPDKPSTFPPSSHTHPHGDITDWGTWFDQYLTQASSPIFPTVKLSNLTDGYIPYHVSDAFGLANSPIYTNGTNVGIGNTRANALLELQGGFGVELLRFGYSAENYHNIVASYNGDYPNGNYLGFNIEYVSNDIRRVMTLFGDGNVVIGGTDAQGYKLRVYGSFMPASLYLGSYYLDTLIANNKVPDSDKWGGHVFSDYLDQAVKQASSIVLVALNANGLVQCDSFRIDQTPTLQTISCDHYITINCNGTNYRIPCVQ
jgi:hypothetical protein